MGEYINKKSVGCENRLYTKAQLQQMGYTLIGEHLVSWTWLWFLSNSNTHTHEKSHSGYCLNTRDKSMKNRTQVPSLYKFLLFWSGSDYIDIYYILWYILYLPYTTLYNILYTIIICIIFTIYCMRYIIHMIC